MSPFVKQPKSGRLIGYARVSTDKQTTDQQITALKKAGCNPIFTDDGVKATARKRKGLMNARNALKAGDVFVVWGIDRAFRSTLDAIAFLDDLHAHGILFQSLTQQIDPRSPEGRKWYIDTASWAEYERAVISRRTKEKMAEAKRRGQSLGPPFKLSKRRALHAHKSMQSGKADLADMAAHYQVAPITIKRAFKRYGLEGA